MYCSTCGAAVPSGRRECATCGARQAPPARAEARGEGALETSGGRRVPLTADRARQGSSALAHCPRCSYQGQGLPYFTRGAHVAALVGATVLTAGAMGAGGIVYYVVRKNHVICPRCGAGWGREAERARVRSGVAGEREAEGGGALAMPAAARESSRRGFSTLLFLFAALCLLGGVLGAAWEAVVVAAFAAGAAGLLRHSANQEREKRRRALISSLQLPVLQLAARSGGLLTVSHAAAELGWTLPRAEKVLASLEDGFRVSSTVTDEGVIVYEFRELVETPDRPLLRAEDEADDDDDSAGERRAG